VSARYRALDAALAAGAIPDGLLRAGSRYGALARQRKEMRGGVAAQEERLRALLVRMCSGPIAELPQKANEQHYELTPEFFSMILGPRRKYSGCLWQPGTGTLAQAEDAMLALTCKRAQIKDGMRILDLGCGWGSLSLWLAEHYPGAEIIGVSNSASQREYIESCRDRQGFKNLTIVTADVNDFESEGKFDRVVSIEMFEHVRNWQELLRRLARWLSDDGKLFVHVFSHRAVPYLFEGTWAAERFFTAGLMPSHELLMHFQRDMVLEQRWAVPGTHYAQTLRAWLERLDANRDGLMRLLTAEGRSKREARTMLGGWRLFLISTEEIWGSGHGDRWLVSHYLLSPRR
jgi:cyclopropane-fatty-acyl-phospholipid synthase